MPVQTFSLAPGRINKSKGSTMPSVSKAQRGAMRAAAAGKSSIGIPKKVGAEYVAADKARPAKKLPQRVSEGRKGLINR